MNYTLAKHPSIPSRKLLKKDSFVTISNEDLDISVDLYRSIDGYISITINAHSDSPDFRIDSSNNVTDYDTYNFNSNSHNIILDGKIISTVQLSAFVKK